MRDIISERISRNAEGAPCKCGGYGDKSDNRPTNDEIKSYDCGRDYACCTAVFKCRLCGKEFIASLEAPEY